MESKETLSSLLENKNIILVKGDSHASETTLIKRVFNNYTKNFILVFCFEEKMKDWSEELSEGETANSWDEALYFSLDKENLYSTENLRKKLIKTFHNMEVKVIIVDESKSIPSQLILVLKNLADVKGAKFIYSSSRESASFSLFTHSDKASVLMGRATVTERTRFFHDYTAIVPDPELPVERGTGVMLLEGGGEAKGYLIKNGEVIEDYEANIIDKAVLEPESLDYLRLGVSAADNCVLIKTTFGREKNVEKILENIIDYKYSFVKPTILSPESKETVYARLSNLKRFSPDIVHIESLEEFEKKEFSEYKSTELEEFVRGLENNKVIVLLDCFAKDSKLISKRDLTVLSKLSEKIFSDLDSRSLLVLVAENSVSTLPEIVRKHFVKVYSGVEQEEENVEVCEDSIGKFSKPLVNDSVVFLESESERKYFRLRSFENIEAADNCW